MIVHTLSARVSDDTLNRIVQIESAGDPKAKAKTSTALGLGQFLDGTWLSCVAAHEPELLENQTRRQVLALRTDPRIALRMLARHTEDNLQVMGAGAGNGDIYLAHFLGAGTARSLLRAGAQTPVASVVSAKAIKANKSILAGKTCGEVRAWAGRKMAVAPRQNWVAVYCAPPVPLVRPPVAPVDTEAPDPGLKALQGRLKALGYHEVGMVDGRAGSRMVAAIAAFKADRGVPGEAVVDQALMTALAEAEMQGFQRPIATVRAEMSEQEVAAEVPPVQQSRWSRFLAKLGIGGAGGAIGFDWFAERFEALREVAEPAARLAAKMPWQLWAAAVLFVFLLIWRSQRKAVAEGVKLMRDGRLMS